MPRIGELRKRVVIKSRADQESGLYSGVSTRETVTTIWAKIANVSGTSQIDSRNAGTGITHRIWIRWRFGVTTQNEILYTDRTGETFRYAIQTVQIENDERNRFLVLDCLQMAEETTLDNPSPELVEVTPETIQLTGTGLEIDDIDIPRTGDANGKPSYLYTAGFIVVVAWDSDNSQWVISYIKNLPPVDWWINPSTDDDVPKTGWSIGQTIGSPAPTVVY